jgi:dihydrofolate synthase/folylpolyglutamate synthase
VSPRPLFLIIGMINTKDPVGYFQAFKGLGGKGLLRADPRQRCDDRSGHRSPTPRLDAGLIAEPMSTVAEALGSHQGMPSNRSTRHAS